MKKFFQGFVLLWMFLLPLIALAQVTASVVGTVKDASGAVVPGASVTVKNLETGAVRTVTADDQGYYRALSLPVGSYEVSAEKTGFKTERRTGINLVVGQEAAVNLTLEVGEVQQAVTVSAEAPIVDTTTASTSGLVGEQVVKDMPLNGRSFDNLITLNPGTVSTTALKQAGIAIPQGNFFSISGQRVTDNLFLLNGIELAGAGIIGTMPGGVSGQLLGIDAVREFNVVENTAGAEYGKRVGGHINVVTQSGSNSFHGTAFEFLRNDDLDARNFFDVAKKPFRRNDFGGAAGGPIHKDKTFIFGNYEGYRQSLLTTTLAFVPDVNARQGLLPVGPGNSLVNVGVAPGVAPYFALWPQPNGPDLAGGIAESFYPGSNPVREDFGIVRVDQNFSEKDTLSGSYNIDDGINTTPDADPLFGTLFTERAQVLSLQETHILSPAILNTARIGFSRANFYGDTEPLISVSPNLSFIAGRPVGIINIGGGGAGGGSTISPVSTRTADNPYVRNLFSYTDSIQISKGRHLFDLGAFAQRVEFNFLNDSDAYGTMTFTDLQHFIQGQAASFDGQLNYVWAYCRQWLGAWYASDTFKATHNLTLTLGLRHEFTNGWNFTPPAGSNYPYVNGVIQAQPYFGTSMMTGNRAEFLFEPRVGLAWDVFANGKTVVHAGYGSYHDLMDDLEYVMPAASKVDTFNIQFPVQYVPGQPIPGSTPAARNLEPTNPATPSVQQWSFKIEQQLTPSTALSLGYVGSHGYHLLVNDDSNPAISVICSTSLGNCPANIPNGTKYFPTGSPRLNPAIGSTTTWTAEGDSSYQALQIDLRQRFTKGLSFRANYTLSKSLDDSSQLSSSFYSNCPSHLLDYFNPLRDYSLSCFNTPQRLSFNGSYDLPIGQGRALLSGVTGAAAKLASGWKVNAILTVQSGLPFTTLVGFNNSNNGDTSVSERPNLNPSFSGPTIVGTQQQWFNPHAFVLPTTGTFGNVGRSFLGGPPLSELDLSLFKDTKIGERLNLEFRAELFNILNHSNFGEPSNNIFTSSGAIAGSAGVINYTSTNSRQIQFGLKLRW